MVVISPGLAKIRPTVLQTAVTATLPDIASYHDIRDSLMEDMKRIFGQDIYLENDSQDYQLISAFALMLYDTQQALLLAYNNI